MAKTLEVAVSALTGQPYDQHGRHRDRIHSLVPGLRYALTYWDLPPETDPAGSRPWPELLAAAEQVAKLRRAANHTALTEMLPRDTG